jgi:carotenoid cleavage dioxygenase-like enzyme
MIHAIRIKDGRLYYCNRLTQTPRVVDEMKAKQALNIRIGEFVSVFGLFKSVLLTL